jgi:hypothetical protein
MSDNGSFGNQQQKPEDSGQSEYLNIKVSEALHEAHETNTNWVPSGVKRIAFTIRVLEFLASTGLSGF